MTEVPNELNALVASLIETMQYATRPGEWETYPSLYVESDIAYAIAAANAAPALLTHIEVQAQLLTASRARIETLSKHLAAMCGWAELLAEEQGWRRANAATYWASRDAAREALK